jgi:glycine hydroxymethyltransferase
MSPDDLADRIEALTARGGEWREHECINLNPAESGMSARARALLSSPLATRLTEGLPGDKLYPPAPQNEQIDQIEAIVIALARQQFGARFVEWRPISTSMANMAAFFALLQPGDRVLAASDNGGGGNYSYNPGGPISLARAEVSRLAITGDTFEIDLAACRAQAREVGPRMIVVGGSHVLFPYPLAELRAIADEVGAFLLYDAAHLGLLISSGSFQRPLDEGAHLVTVSTHKIMGGPVGGMILTHDAEIAGRLQPVVFPGLLQTRDLNKYAALALSLAETQAHGPELAQRMCDNARSLGRALRQRGFDVVAADRDFTRTHQIFVDLGGEAAAAAFEQTCLSGNILLARCVLARSAGTWRREGVRLAVHELSLAGMDRSAMEKLADLMSQARDGQSSDRLRAQVAELLSGYPHRPFSLNKEP